MTHDEFKRFNRLQDEIISCVSDIEFYKRLLNDCGSDAFDGADYNWDAIERFLTDCLTGCKDTLTSIEDQYRAMKVIEMKEKELKEVKS